MASGEVFAAREPAIHWAVWRWAEETPFSIAITDRGRHISYRELAARADSLARKLRQLGITHESLVGISAERSAAFVIAVLAVMRAGGAYLPLDPAYPAERRSFLLQDSGCPLVLTDARLQSLYADTSAATVPLDSFVEGPLVASGDLGVPAAGTAEQEGTAAPLPQPGFADDSLAYVIYTSGSTGKPKGVCVTHANLLRLFRQTETWFGFTSSDVLTLFHSFSFDFSVWEMWAALLYGGRLVMVPYELSRDPLGFYGLVRSEGVTVLNQTPAEFRLFMRADALASERAEQPGLALRYVMLGGEALDLRTLRPWFSRHGETTPQLFNLYGITETTVIITYRPLHSADVEETRSLIGVPIPDLDLQVLDAGQQPVPEGAEGELWVGGAGVARGYLNRPQLTAERFVAANRVGDKGPGDGAADGGRRLYRTGDLVRRHPDGELEYLGRIDQQVKIDGHRIELGEIEAALRGLPGISDAAVVVRRDDSRASLAAYVVPRADAMVDLAELKERLRAQLPDYLCPSSLQAVPRIPLTQNGKLDREALPPPVAAEKGAIATTWNAHQQTVAGLFAAALGRTVETLDADFFEGGGSSLQAMQLALQLAEQHGVTLPPAAIFAHSTVRELAALLDGLQAAPPPAPVPLPAIDESAWQPLSPIQEQMWFVQSLSPESPAFHCPAATRLRGELDVERLRRALQRAQERHPLLRARFGIHNDRPMQRTADAPTFDLQLLDGDQAPEALAERLRQLSRRPFDLGQAAGAAWLVRGAADEHIFLLVLHHLITDGWSLAGLLGELAADYNQTPISAPRHSYFQHAAARRQSLDSPRMRESESYFLANLAEAPPHSELPPEHPRPRTPSLRGALRAFHLPEAAREEMRPLMTAEGATVNTVLFSALFALLQRYSGGRDLVIGMPYACRDAAGSESLQGPLLNLLPIRVRLADPTSEASFRQLLRGVRQATHAAFAHSELPFSRLRERLQGEHDPSRHPLFQLAFAPQPGTRAALRLGGLQTSPVPVDPGKSPYDLTLYAWPETTTNPTDGSTANAALYCELEYATDLYSAAHIDQLIDHLGRLLLAGCRRPDSPLAELDMLSESERSLLLDEWSGRAASRSLATTTPPLPLALFAGQVAAQPDAEALRCGSQGVSYVELDRWSGRIAAALTELGIGRESRVALACPRCPAAIAGILGVWKAGAAYVPLDPNYPEARLEFMLRDSGATLILTVPETADLLSHAGRQLDLLALAQTEVAGPRGDEPQPPHEEAGRALAYIIYTSGSTGQPKGVLIEQRSLAALAQAIPAAFPLPSGQRLLQFASLSFDWSVAELLIALSQGGTLVIPAQRTPLVGGDLFEFLAQERIHQVLLPPSVLSQLPDKPLPDLRLLLVGGEACPAQLVERFAGDRSFRNAYGPTETTIVATVGECRPAAPGDTPMTPAIGRPLAGWLVFVLDATGRLVPPRVPGELYIGGPGLSRGYHGRPELCRERFPEHMPDVTERLYRTGDLVRWRADGELEFLGRRDEQRKVRGFRIELGEIESALASQPGVKTAVVRVDGEGAAARLLAYVVRGDTRGGAPDPGEGEFLGELRRNLRALLPPQMIPSEFIGLPSLPLTPNGKLDVRALPRHAEATSGDISTQGEWEALVAEIWLAVLGRAVPRTANFFDVGGSSLRLIEVQVRLEAKLGVRIPLADLFANPTIEAMGTLIGRGRPSAQDTQRSAAERAARAQAQKPSGRRGR
ncbi:MAG TPA: amino acid adenylation domain-containing protein [Pseudomonadota bacterium]|nr:amino acid adenylation domain-containing protein [Pseudomonadota bacterium]